MKYETSIQMLLKSFLFLTCQFLQNTANTKYQSNPQFCPSSIVRKFLFLFSDQSQCKFIQKREKNPKRNIYAHQSKVNRKRKINKELLNFFGIVFVPTLLCQFYLWLEKSWRTAAIYFAIEIYETFSIDRSQLFLLKKKQKLFKISMNFSA